MCRSLTGLYRLEYPCHTAKSDEMGADKILETMLSTRFGHFNKNGTFTVCVSACFTTNGSSF